MSNASALFARIGMSRDACDRWLDSPIRFVSDYADWPLMNPVMASNYEYWRETFPQPEYMSIREFLEAIADLSRYFTCEYDDELNAFFIADAKHKSSMLEIAVCVAALRGVQDFKDDDSPSFIHVFPAASGGDPEALLKIEQGSSRFLHMGEDDPDLLYFLSEAEDFIEALLDEDE